MSAQQRKLQEQMWKQGYQPLKRSQFYLKPIHISKPIKTEPDLVLTKNVQLNLEGINKLQRIVNTYRPSNGNIRITAKRTSIQRLSIKDQFKNYVRFFSTLQLDGLDAIKNLIKNTDTLICGINKSQNIEYLNLIMCDGHGQSGKELSQIVSQQFTEELTSLFSSTPILTLSLTMKENLKRLFSNIDNKLKIQNDLLDIKLSGTSLLSIIIINNVLYCSNVGDSKAAFFYKSETLNENPKEVRKFIQKNLNVAHDTNSDKEIDRIMRRGGKIDQALFKGQHSGSLRIWVPKQSYPGIKITRCFGNEIGKQIGIISDPDIVEFKIPKSGYLLVASTGLWEKLDILVIESILDAHNPPTSWADVDKAMKLIGNETKKCWDVNGEGLIDISLNLIYLQL